MTLVSGKLFLVRGFSWAGGLSDDVQPAVDATKLSTIRLKLEEKRRHIEQEKRKLEAAVSKYQQKVGKAAFLQAINKVRGFIGWFIGFCIMSFVHFDFCFNFMTLKKI